MLLLLAAVAGLRADTAVHGVLSGDQAISLLRRRIGGFSEVDMLVRRSTCNAVLTSCHALRSKNSFAILQMKGDSSAMFVCSSQKGAAIHRLVAVLHSNEDGVPFSAMRDALAWHSERFPDMKMIL